MSEKKKAWVYTRIDAPEDVSGSLKRQDQNLTTYAEHMGWEIVGHSQDLESGNDMERPGLQDMTNAVISGEVDVIVISNPSRISRCVRNINAYAETLQTYGVEVYSPERGKIEELCAPILAEDRTLQEPKLFN